MNVNGKKIPVETISQMGVGRIKENDGGGEFMYDIFDIYCMNLCKCYNVPLSSTIQ
jgi:hypothetical protein